MILGIVFIGMIAGLLALAAAVVLSAPLWAAALAYVLGGTAGTLLAGLFVMLRHAAPQAETKPRPAPPEDRQAAARRSPKGRRARKTLSSQTVGR